ncbi:Calcium-binding EF-hand [Cynara cardunculus var. scolymus]|uniref:Calcium-binding EF-hand n=1 Tax=Cynara cardunculus var. scolymus TaxID=59895 RepID=A0A124SET5_CYNCS|nr:Calcium-binding EF-hand [Cynara cardunculus var. scolymus]
MEIVSSSIASCPKEHRKIYQQWFDYIDSDGDGRITGIEATEFLAMSKLAKSELKQVWTIADSKRQGFLGFKEFITAMQVRLLFMNTHYLHLQLYKNLMVFYFMAIVDVERLELPAMEGLGSFLAKRNASRNDGSLESNGMPALNSLFSSKSSKKVSIFTHAIEHVVEDYFLFFSFQTALSEVTSIVDGLKKLYNDKLKPLEVTYQYNDFVSPLLTNSDFDAKPMVMLLGQYSTGKTTFIKHMLKSNYPDERSIPGNTIAVRADMPFTGLATFGGAFLSKFECSQMNHPLLEHISFVDSPGVLSGEKQRTQRSYDFTGVIKWFAEKCDLILLLFDPHKLDISDEFKRVISTLHGQDDKIRVVLNKADQLMRVYGALMWSLGKVLNTPEVARVYIGSFGDKPVNLEALDSMGKELFEKEQDDLLLDLIDIPKKACDRRINEFVKRARAAKIHAYIIGHLKKEMPTMLGKTKAQQKLVDNLQDEFAKIQRDHHLPPGDFPDVEHFREVLGTYNIDKFEKVKSKMIQVVDDMLAYDIPELLKNFRNPYD